MRREMAKLQKRKLEGRDFGIPYRVVGRLRHAYLHAARARLVDIACRVWACSFRWPRHLLRDRRAAALVYRAALHARRTAPRLTARAGETFR